MSSVTPLRVAYITAGAAGMFCGSCIHDNTLVATLQAQGHDALLIPTYTPIRTDEYDVSQRRVFFGGINVYLQQKLAFFRHTPWVLDRLLDANGLLRWVSRFAVKTQAEQLGSLTVSMLQGEHGHQSKEVAKLAQWLAEDVKPQVVNVSNVLLSGIVAEIKRKTGAPVVATLQGDDIFLEALPEPYRSQSLQLIRDHCRQINGFITTSAYYAEFMADYLTIPRNRIDVVYPGLNLAGHDGVRAPANGPPYTVGYFARICPEKGLHHLVDAMRQLWETPGAPRSRLRVAGWLGEHHRPYFDDLCTRVRSWGFADRLEHVEAPDHASKIQFLQSLDVLSVPTTYREPKGLYILEALANGVPVVQPRHGSFPELIETTGGGVLVNPNDPEDLARTLHRLLEDGSTREELGRNGKDAVHRFFHAARMADETVAIYRKYLS